MREMERKEEEEDEEKEEEEVVVVENKCESGGIGYGGGVNVIAEFHVGKNMFSRNSLKNSNLSSRQSNI